MRELMALAVLVAAANLGAAEDVDYLRQVKPLLATRCASCHGALAQKGNLRLDTADAVRKGGRGGPAVVPGKGAESLLLAAVLGKGRGRMPPEDDGSALTAEQIATLKAWIDQGAKGPANEPVPPGAQEHWAFRKLAAPAIPQVEAAGWGVSPVD